MDSKILENQNIKINKTSDITKYMKDYMRNYYLKNKNKINTQEICELCHKKYLKRHKKTHLSTKNHKFLELQKELNNLKSLL